MATVVLLRSALGIRQGEVDAAQRLRADGHEVLVPDLFDGRTFPAYEPAMAWADSLGMPALFKYGLAAVANLPDGFVVGGFSRGCNVAGLVATRRSVTGVLQLSGLTCSSGSAPTRRGQPAANSQCHQMLDDPFREDEITAQALQDAADAGAHLELLDYPGNAVH